MTEHLPEHDGFDDVIDLLRDRGAGEGAAGIEEPPATLWAGIADELGLTEGAADDGSGVDGPSEVGDENVVSLADARAKRAWGRPAAWLTAVAAAVLLVGVPIGLSLDSGDDRELVASIDLAWLAGEPGATAEADLVRIDDDLQLELRTGATAGDGEFLELWLLDTDEVGVADLISLGRVSGTSDSYDVPDDLDLSRFDVVDVSVELDDGNPDHSGNSILRSDPFTA